MEGTDGGCWWRVLMQGVGGSYWPRVPKNGADGGCWRRVLVEGADGGCRWRVLVMGAGVGSQDVFCRKLIGGSEVAAVVVVALCVYGVDAADEDADVVRASVACMYFLEKFFFGRMLQLCDGDGGLQ